MKKIKYLLLIFPIFLITGCYNYRELNQLAITSAVGIDKIEEGYRVTIQVMNTQKQSSSNSSGTDQPKFITYIEEGKNIQEAFRNIVLNSPRRLYANHISLLVIGEEVAKDGIYNILDWFFRDAESRKQFSVIVSKGSKAEDILTTLTPLETLNAKNIKDSITSDSNFLGIAEEITFEQLMSDFLNDKKEISLPSIELIGNKEEGEKYDNLEEADPNAKVILGNMAVFKDDKLLGFMNREESIVLSYLKNEINNSIFSHQCGDNKYAVIGITSSDTSIEAEKNNTKINIKIKLTGNINEIYCDLNLEDNKVIKQLEKNIGDDLKNQINNTIKNVSNQYNSDVFGFEDLFYKTNPKYFYTLKDNWYNDIFKNIEIDTEVKIQLFGKGNILKVTEYD